MSRRRQRYRPFAEPDFSAGKAKLKGISDGLGSLFDRVSSLIDEIESRPETAASNQRIKADFDIKIGTLDDAIQSTRRGPRAQPQAKRQAAMPLGAEHFLEGDCIMVVITLGKVQPKSVQVVRRDDALVVRAGSWSYRIEGSDGFDPIPAQRNLKNGYLTLTFARNAPAPDAHTEEFQE